METVQLSYSKRDISARKMLEILFASGKFSYQEMPKKRKLTGLEEADEDIRLGRVYQAKDAKDLIAQCLRNV